MGEVFLARSEGPAGFAKSLVIKRIQPHLARDAGFVEMFLNEARLSALISHPNVVQIFELGEENGNYFIAMEHIDGCSLRRVARALDERGRCIPPALVAHVASQALQGLHHAHTLEDAGGRLLGIVHRDVTPDNVLLSRQGAVKLVDFGIAKAASGTTGTRSGVLKGKFPYLAPELFEGKPASARSDLYSVGVVLYELLSGERPFRGGSDAELMAAVLHAPLIPLRERVPDLDEGLEAIVLRALAREPEERFPSAGEMSLALDRSVAALGAPTGAGALAALVREVLAFEPHPGEQGRRGSPAQEGGGAAIPQAAAGGVRSSTLPPQEPATSPTSPTAATEVETPSRSVRSRNRALLWLGGVALGGLLVVAATGLLAVRQARPARNPDGASGAPPSRPGGSGASATASDTLASPSGLSPPGAPESEVPTAPERATAVTPQHRPSSRPSASPRPKRAPATGRVGIRVNPWAEVSLGKRRLGLTPMDPVELPAGAHILTLRNPELGKVRRVSVSVRPGELVWVKEDLEGGPP